MQYKFRRFFIPKVKLLFGLIVLVVSLAFVFKLAVFSVSLLRQFASPLQQTDGRTNLLLLGIPGGNHAGADLTDSIMVLSYSHTKKTLALISLPRDIWSDTLKDKINSAYHYGEEKKKGGGLVLAKVITEDIVGIPIHYALVIDFSGFKKVIDDVGGVDVVVAEGFIDDDFPIEGKEDDLCDGDPKFRCRYETIQFSSGLQRMDGATALKYVRSRNAEGDEGTDFARGRRQQEVIVALKSKLTNPFAWPSFNKSALLQSLDAATDTDMKLGEFLTFAKRASRVNENNTQRISIEEQLTAQPLWMYGGKYVLLPKESYEELHQFIKSQLQRKPQQKQQQSSCNSSCSQNRRPGSGNWNLWSRSSSGNRS